MSAGNLPSFSQMKIEHLESRRLLNAGDVDTTSGSAGVAEIAAGSFQALKLGVTTQGQGLVTAGDANASTSITLLRRRPDGTVDTRFGPDHDGRVDIQLLSGLDQSLPIHTVIAPDDRILVQTG